jgi:hypothetical protein
MFSLGALFTPAASQLALSSSNPTLIYDRSEPIADAVCATLKVSNTLYVWRSSWNVTIKYSGTLGNPQQTRVTPANTQNKDIFAIPSRLQSSVKVNALPLEARVAPPSYRMVNFYLKNVYSMGNNQLLGFLHLEYMAWVKSTNPAYCPTGYYCPDYNHTTGQADHYSIGLAYSSNNGNSWTFLGDIIRTNDHTANLGGNIGGAAYVVVPNSNGGDFYAYFNEKPASGNPYPSVAKANINSVKEAALAQRVTSSTGGALWKKYDAGTNSFYRDPISGLGSPILAGANLDMHSDAAYSSALGQYMLTVNEPVDATTRALALYRSKDGVKWFRGRTLAQSYTGADNKRHHPCYPYFASLAGDASADNSTVGRAFSVFYISESFTGQWVATDEPVYRVDLTVSDMLPIANMLQ